MYNIIKDYVIYLCARIKIIACMRLREDLVLELNEIRKKKQSGKLRKRRESAGI